jgi:RHS repeat-associated protein
MITNQYTYNGDGQRVQIVDSQGTKKQIWDVENILLETDGSDTTQVVYTLEPARYGNLVSQRRGSTTSTHLFDALGSTRKLTDSTGAVTDSYDYRAYGETYASSGTTTNVFRWVGELGYYYDIDRSAYYLRARHYSPALARFLSQDPIGFEGSKWNLYEYVGSRPIGRADPGGRAGLGIGAYGNYCGLLRKATCDAVDKPSPLNTPVDDVDRCCMVHDCCLAGWQQCINPWREVKCNWNFCRCICNTTCANSPTPYQCLIFRRILIELCPPCNLW